MTRRDSSAPSDPVTLPLDVQLMRSGSSVLVTLNALRLRLISVR